MAIDLPTELTPQASDSVGINPNMTIRPLLDKALDKALAIETGYREVAQTYKDVARSYTKSKANYERMSRQADQLLREIKADTARIQRETQEAMKPPCIPTAEVGESRMVSETAKQPSDIVSQGQPR